MSFLRIKLLVNLSLDTIITYALSDCAPIICPRRDSLYIKDGGGGVSYPLGVIKFLSRGLLVVLTASVDIDILMVDWNGTVSHHLVLYSIFISPYRIMPINTFLRKGFIVKK